MGLFDEEGSEDGGGLFGPPQPANPPTANTVQATPLSVTPCLSVSFALCRVCVPY